MFHVCIQVFAASQPGTTHWRGPGRNDLHRDRVPGQGQPGRLFEVQGPISHHAQGPNRIRLVCVLHV